MDVCDYLIIGAGIAGASAGFELAARGRVVVLERESQPGYHATGRSAALFSETYGPPVIRALSVASGRYYREAVAHGLSEHPVLTPRGVVMIGRADQLEALDRAVAEFRRLVPTVERLDAAEALERVPVLRTEYVAGAVWEPDAMDLDVHAIHIGYLKGLRARGGRVVTDAGVTGLRREGGLWVADTPAGRFAAPVVVDAAGAWADEVARLAGVRTVGLVPKRRTAVVFDPVLEQPGLAAGIPSWPMVFDVDETFYFKPETGRVLASPADETPVDPCDAQPDEWDVAVAIDRVEQAAAFSVRRIAHKWAGLRSFVADKEPVVGEAPDAPGFFWLAGQGGYGIQTAPAMARAAAALATGQNLPEDLRDLGITEAALAPDRPALRNGEAA